MVKRPAQNAWDLFSIDRFLFVLFRTFSFAAFGRSPVRGIARGHVTQPERRFFQRDGRQPRAALGRQRLQRAASAPAEKYSRMNG